MKCKNVLLSLSTLAFSSIITAYPYVLTVKNTSDVPITIGKYQAAVQLQNLSDGNNNILNFGDITIAPHSEWQQAYTPAINYNSNQGFSGTSVIFSLSGANAHDLIGCFAHANDTKGRIREVGPITLSVNADRSISCKSWDGRSPFF